MLLLCFPKDGAFACSHLCIFYIHAWTQLWGCEGQQSMVSSGCTSKSTLLFSGALLPFSWLGRGNGTWGLSRGDPVSQAALLVLVCALPLPDGNCSQGCLAPFQS